MPRNSTSDWYSINPGGGEGDGREGGGDSIGISSKFLVLFSLPVLLNV